ncbi:MAG: hypothetical protein JXQ65_14280 [Candidatus Marinimicrobia bacterium]|nr:hypothetical protein [Candidatus Neomarinimicrobiota bacterium]
MKRSILIILSLAILLHAQVFNTARTLNKSKLSATGGYGFYDGGGVVVAKFGYGLGNQRDLALTMGFGDFSYLGLDFEKVLPWENLDYLTMSLAPGIHYSDGFVLDLTWNCSVPLDKSLILFSGLDMDLLINEGSGVPLSWFVGMELAFQRRLTLLGEYDLGLNNAGNCFGLGLCFYFSGIAIK